MEVLGVVFSVLVLAALCGGFLRFLDGIRNLSAAIRRRLARRAAVVAPLTRAEARRAAA